MSRQRRDAEIAAARERADLARMRLRNAADATRTRLQPSRLKADAAIALSDRFDKALRDLGNLVRKRPFIAAGIVLGLGTSLFWSPARLVARKTARIAWLAWLYRKLWKA
jgi:hypothetical protein